MNINFVNPYNFVPLHNEKSEAPKEERTLSGVIEYSLLTKTPLFIPNTSSDRAFNNMLEEQYNKNKKAKKVLDPKKNKDYHKSFEFYSYEDLDGRTDRTGHEIIKPIIPGSSIRGMFRSNYEILTNSCMSVLNEKKLKQYTTKDISVITKGYIPCQSIISLCPACQLFGTLETKPGEPSRIDFTDLMLAPGTSTSFSEPVTISELSSPKIQNMEFYVQRPSEDARFWTYDTFINGNGETIQTKSPAINGRKYYWHNLNMEIEKTTPNKRNITIRPLKSAMFIGKLYFENLSKPELDTLIYLLNAGEYENKLEDKEHGYKLGAAKPLGFGSVAVCVNSITLRNLTVSGDLPEEKNFEWKKDNNYELSKPELLNEDAFQIMTSFEIDTDKEIRYPTENGNGYDWFKKNRENNQYKYYLEPIGPDLKAVNSEKKEDTSLAIGAIVEGTITGIKEYGAFVALPNGQSGLIHISEMPEDYFNNKSLSVRDTVTVKVISPHKEGKISLSLKQET